MEFLKKQLGHELLTPWDGFDSPSIDVLVE
jgi:hypothetical protein